MFSMPLLCCLLVGHLNSKSDIYGLGILILEILTGKKSMGFHYAKWAEENIGTSKTAELNWIDPKIRHELESKVEQKVAKKLAHVAIKCVSKNPKARPQVSDFAQYVIQMAQTDAAEV